MAVGSAAILAAVNVLGCGALAVAVGGAFGLSFFGLPGVIYGVGLGWLFQAAMATVLAMRAFRQRWDQRVAPA